VTTSPCKSWICLETSTEASEEEEGWGGNGLKTGRSAIEERKTLARPIITYGSEAWTIRRSVRTRITANEIKFLRRTAGYTKLDKRNTEILRELKINSVLEHIDQCRNNWKQHVQRMDRSRIP
jgi:hypothetical protein